jgi:hypothetical protein
MFPSLTRIQLVLLAIVSLLVTAASEVDKDGAAKSWLEDCRQAGFDPFELACRTCELLPSKNQKACLECCQSYKDVERFSKPYEAAVLVVSTRTGEEFERFMDEDWKNLVNDKGEDRLVQVSRERERGSSYSYFMTPPTVLYLLDERHNKSGMKTASEYAKVAKETLYLDDWKRDDIRDMLATLLS